jgi:hypothetical protein
MRSRTNKKVGLFIPVLGAVCFFSSFIYFFGWSNNNIEYRNVGYMLKLACTFGFALLGLYFGLYFISWKKIAVQLGGSLALLLVVAYMVGFVLHVN